MTSPSDTSQDGNIMTIAKILDGRNFYVPSYQRGYRWKKDQVIGLIDDLLEFAFDRIGEGKGVRGTGYLLQPIIVRKIKDKDNTWEVIDGQQRLTTVLIILNCILKEPEEELKENGRIAYSMEYETRPELGSKLRDIRKYVNQDDGGTGSGIDYFYMREAYRHIEEHISADETIERFRQKGPNISQRKFKDILRDVLISDAGGAENYIQIFWYELEDTPSSSGINLFCKINAGKILLEQSELVKALLLQEKNFNKDDKLTQIQGGLQWEELENKLNDDAFWGFLHKDGNGVEFARRMETFLELLYPKGVSLFDAVNNELLTELPTDGSIDGIFDKIRHTFRSIEDWFNEPDVYNYIGLITEFGDDKIHDIFNMQKIFVENGKDKEYFIKECLRNKVYQGLWKSSAIDHKSGEIRPSFAFEKDKDKQAIKRLLLTYNIMILIEQYESYRSRSTQDSSTPRCPQDCNMYKFPFSVYNQREWHIEHISPQTKNAKEELKEEQKFLKDNNAYEKIIGNTEYSKIINADLTKISTECAEELLRNLRRITDNEMVDENSERNRLGNFALLDSGTNESYKNAVFLRKKHVIAERIREGFFIPIGTHRAFFKVFNPLNSSPHRWMKEDMLAYEQDIKRQIEKLKPCEQKSN